MRSGLATHLHEGTIKERDSTQSGTGLVNRSLTLLQIFAVAWSALSFVLIILVLPEQLVLFGLGGILLGVPFAIVGVLRGRSMWIQFSMLDLWLIFFVLLLSEALSESLELHLPFLLLQLVVLLFAVEILATASRVTEHALAEAPRLGQSVSVYFDAYVKRASNRIARVGLFFAGSYVITVMLLFVGIFITSAVPLLADISIYIVVVSVSLALLLMLREEQHG